MARFHGIVGFIETGETAPDVWDAQKVTKRFYYGDILKRLLSLSASPDSTNDSIRISNQLSLISDAYMRQHLDIMRFVVFNGTPWRVATIELDEKRVIVTLGEVYNGITD